MLAPFKRALSAHQAAPQLLKHSPAAGAAPAAGCARGGCGANGTCNEASGHCDCSPGFVGPTCSQLAVPACLAPGPTLLLPGMRMTCACLRQWVDALGAHSSLLNLETGRQYLPTAACYEAGNLSQAQALAAEGGAPGTWRQLTLRHQGGGGGAHTLEPSAPLLSPADALGQGCGGSACSWRGACQVPGPRNAGTQDDAVPGEAPRCSCIPRGAVFGPACEHGTPWCYNQCRGRGVCELGVCVCEPGFWGLDCSSTRAAGPEPAAAALLRAGGPQLQPHRPAGGLPRPRIYVYDLPASLSSWHLSVLGPDSDYGRRDGAAMLEAMLRSGHRTADPGKADYFVLPVSGGADVSRLRSLRYVAQRWPFFNASVARGVANHIWPTICDDGGIASSPELRGVMARAQPAGGVGSEADSGGPDGYWASVLEALPLEIRHSIFLTCNGLHWGQVRGLVDAPRLGPPPAAAAAEAAAAEAATRGGGVPGWRWWTPSGGVWSKLLEEVTYAGAFVPGKDIRLPWSSHAFEHAEQEHASDGGPPRCRHGGRWATPGLERRETALLWEGAVRRVRSSPNGSGSPFPHNVRLRVVDGFRGAVPGFALRDSAFDAAAWGGASDPAVGGQARTEGLAWHLGSSQLCLATDGGGGGFGSRDIEALAMGCVPLYVNDDTARWGRPCCAAPGVPRAPQPSV